MGILYEYNHEGVFYQNYDDSIMVDYIVFF